MAQGILSSGFRLRFAARGRSMSPFVRDGDVITVTPFGGGALEPGDVAAYICPVSDRLLVHRVVGVRQGAFLFRGDNARAMDGLIPADRVLGRVESVARGGRRVRLGQGAERRVIALASRTGALVRLVWFASRTWRFVVRRRAAA